MTGIQKLILATFAFVFFAVGNIWFNDPSARSFEGLFMFLFTWVAPLGFLYFIVGKRKQ